MKSTKTGILCLLSGALFLASSAVYENKASKWLFGLVGVLELLSGAEIMLTRLVGGKKHRSDSAKGAAV